MPHKARVLNARVASPAAKLRFLFDIWALLFSFFLKRFENPTNVWLFHFCVGIKS